MKKIKKVGVKTKRSCFQVEDPVFNSALFVMVNVPYKKFVDFVKKKIPNTSLSKEDYSGNSGLSVYETKDGIKYYALWMPFFNWNIVSQSVFVHELTHIVEYILEHKGISGRIGETGAYLMEYYMRECWKRLKKYA